MPLPETSMEKLSQVSAGYCLLPPPQASFKLVLHRVMCSALSPLPRARAHTHTLSLSPAPSLSLHLSNFLEVFATYLCPSKRSLFNA